MTQNNKNLILLCMALAMFSGLSVDVLLPGLPSMGKALQASHSQTQLIISIFFLGYGIVQLFYGIFSDWKGRKPGVIVSLVIYLVGTIGCLCTDTISLIYLFRIIQAIGACGAIVSSFALARTYFNEPHYVKVVTYITVGMSLFPILFSVIGGYLSFYLTWHADFVFAAGVATLMLFACAYTLPNETPHTQAPRFNQLLNTYKRMLRDKIYWSYTLCGTTIFIALLGLITVIPFFYVTDSVDPSADLGYWLGANSLFLVLGSLGVRFLEKHKSLKSLIRYGSGIMIGGGILWLVLLFKSTAPSALSLFGPMYLISLGIGSIMPATQAGLLAPYKEAAGQAAAFAGFFRFVLASLIAGTLLYFPHPLVVLGALVILMGTVNFLFVVRG